jgi:hypothetical protein
MFEPKPKGLLARKPSEYLSYVISSIAYFDLLIQLISMKIHNEIICNYSPEVEVNSARSRIFTETRTLSRGVAEYTQFSPPVYSVFLKKSALYTIRDT